MRDRRKRWNYDPENYQITGWLIIIVIASFCVVVVLNWYLKRKNAPAIPPNSPTLFAPPRSLKFLHRLVPCRRITAEGWILGKPHCDNPEPRSARRRGGGEKDMPDHFGVAVPHVIIIVKPLAFRPALAGMDENELWVTTVRHCFSRVDDRLARIPRSNHRHHGS